MRFVVTWLTLAVFWLALSGHLDAIHLTFGFVSVTLVAAISSRYFARVGPFGARFRSFLSLLAYCPWLLWQIALANVDVLLRVVGLRPLAPRMVRFRPPVESDFGRVTLANSITLTPGTVTVEVEEDGSFIVHAISVEAAQAVVEGPMVERVRALEGHER